MAIELKGDYFGGQFHSRLNPFTTAGLDSADESIKKYCPADLKNHLWTCAVDYQHIEKVITSSNDGYKSWRKLSTHDRANYIGKYKEILEKRKNEIAEAISYETGRPLWEAELEAAWLSAKVDSTLNESLKRVETKHFENIAPGTHGRLSFKSIGPALVIGPFNFPCHLANGQILSALITGNSIIFKPSDKTIFSGQLLIECFHEAGFPSGVINFITGTAETGRRLLKEKSIKGVYFTGSMEVGKQILKTTHQDLTKLVALELGGKNTTIIHKDAKIDHAMAELVRASFLTTGQRCTSTSIVAIHDSIKDEFIDRFHKLAKRLVIDHPIEFEKEPFMGPLIDQKAVDNYLLFMGMGKREGYSEIMRGKCIQKKHEGYYVSPSIHYIEDPSKKSVFFSSELFAPNVIFTPYTEIDDAINISNMSQYGLAASVFTEDKVLFNQCISEIETGLINLNKSTIGASSKLPFGGFKNSGNYRSAGISMIDHTVHTQSALEIEAEDDVDFDQIKGIN
ncbi:MAG: aldehyde dehydrogenase family protein [Bacteriovoracaceae bacterium]|jgi:succinylglutamic semialdehyde dehydrogenase|nr:aldehyde dehydrogenase family protein [Bacteriovoracaceae bacterium]